MDVIDQVIERMRRDREPTAFSAKEFDESKHARHPAGDERGGEFAPANGVASLSGKHIPCAGGCGKQVTGDYPKADVLCLDCAMKESSVARNKYQNSVKNKNELLERKIRIATWAREKFGDTEKAVAFTKWFGDSKITDADGNPLVLYHGTHNKFTVFEPGRKNPRMIGKEYGIYMATRENYAMAYGDGHLPMRLYANIRNPKIVKDKSEINPYDMTHDDVKRLQAQGYDGVVSSSRDGEIGNVWEADEIVAFESHQVKSENKNKGTYDPSSGDITKSWDESKHARHPKGDERGGEFAPADASVALIGIGSGAYHPDSDPLHWDLTGQPVDKVKEWARERFGSTKKALAFRDWFGDSKIVDEAGIPEVVYHGTNKTFSAFDEDRIGKNTGNYGHYGYGIYLSYERMEAETYGDKIIEAYVSMQNPFIPSEETYLELKRNGVKGIPDLDDQSLDYDSLHKAISDIDPVAADLLSILKDKGDDGWSEFMDKHQNVANHTGAVDLNSVSDLAEHVAGTKVEKRRNGMPGFIREILDSYGIADKVKINQGYDNVPSMHWITELGVRSKEITDVIKELGYDGVIAGSEIVVFDPKQIKSATRNRGTFDRMSSDISKSLISRAGLFLKSWDESKHVRHAAGDERGGEFALKEGAASGSGGQMPKGENRIPEHGQPFDFHYFRNKESAGNHGKTFGQHIEPHGRYMSQVSPDNTQLAVDMPDKYEHGEMYFRNPLVIPFGGGYTEPSNWKNQLSEQFDGKTGKRLSQAIVDAGHDGIVTFNPEDGPRRPAHTSEIVDLTSFTPKESEKSSPVREWARDRFKDAEKAKAFTEWFGDSKITDAEGHPQVMYHGTAEEFSEFEPSRIVNAKQFGNGTYLTADPTKASAYAEGDKSNVMALYVRAENPLNTVEGPTEAQRKAIQEILSRDVLDDDRSYHTGDRITRRFSNADKSQAHDLFDERLDHWEKHGDNYDRYRPDADRDKATGDWIVSYTDPDKIAVSENGREVYHQLNHTYGDNYAFRLAEIGIDAVLFENQMLITNANQIKSATGNRGTFDRNSNDISKSLIERAGLFFKDWDESKHVRHGKGDERGGEFAPKESVAVDTSDDLVNTIADLLYKHDKGSQLAYDKALELMPEDAPAEFSDAITKAVADRHVKELGGKQSVIESLKESRVAQFEAMGRGDSEGEMEARKRHNDVNSRVYASGAFEGKWLTEIIDDEILKDIGNHASAVSDDLINGIIADRHDRNSRVSLFEKPEMKSIRDEVKKRAVESAKENGVDLDMLFTTRKDYIDYQEGKMEEADKRQKEWESNAKRAISLGVVTPDTASVLGWWDSSGNKYTHPPDTLWTVTTATDSVMSSKLKTRDELKQERGAGLGGGATDTISFTDSKDIAEQIKESIREAGKVSRGDITPEEIVEAAQKHIDIRTGKDLDKTMWDKFSKSYVSGELEERMSDRKTLRSFALRKPDDGHEWTAGDEITHDKDGNERSSSWSRPKTNEEKMNDAFDIYKKYAYWREIAGGPIDPLFFSSDVDAIARMPLDQVQILEVKMKPKSRGYKVSSLGEWRVHTGDTVEEMKVINDDRDPNRTPVSTKGFECLFMMKSHLEPNVKHLLTERAGSFFREWDESKHSRHSAGDERGGEFAPKGGSGSADILDALPSTAELVDRGKEAHREHIRKNRTGVDYGLEEGTTDLTDDEKSRVKSTLTGHLEFMRQNGSIDEYDYEQAKLDIEDGIENINKQIHRYGSVYNKYDEIEEIVKRSGIISQPKDISDWAKQKFGPNAENFVQWFGESKAVDKNGMPLVLYHGTPEVFTEFEFPDDFGDSRDGAGFFSPHPEVASGYATHTDTLEGKRQAIAYNEAKDKLDSYAQGLFERIGYSSIPERDSVRNNIMNEGLDEGAITREEYDEYDRLDTVVYEIENSWQGEGQPIHPNVMPVYLRIERPLVVNASGHSWEGIVPETLRTVDRDKHDGVIFMNVVDNADDAEGTTSTYAVFNQASVKSAIGNKGTFDPASPDISKSLFERAAMMMKSFDESKHRRHAAGDDRGGEFAPKDKTREPTPSMIVHRKKQIDAISDLAPSVLQSELATYRGMTKPEVAKMAMLYKSIAKGSGTNEGSAGINDEKLKEVKEKNLLWDHLWKNGDLYFEDVKSRIPLKDSDVLPLEQVVPIRDSGATVEGWNTATVRTWGEMSSSIKSAVASDWAREFHMTDEVMESLMSAARTHVDTEIRQVIQANLSTLVAAGDDHIDRTREFYKHDINEIEELLSRRDAEETADLYEAQRLTTEHVRTLAKNNPRMNAELAQNEVILDTYNRLMGKPYKHKSNFEQISDLWESEDRPEWLSNEIDPIIRDRVGMHASGHVGMNTLKEMFNAKSDEEKLAYGIDSGRIARPTTRGYDGTTKEYFASVVGAPDESVVKLRNSDGEIEINVDANDDSWMMTRTLHRAERYIKNDTFFMDDDSSIKGQGATIFAQQVMHARKSGEYDKIVTDPGRGDTMNGHYTWFRSGYNAPIESLKGSRAGMAKAQFPKAKTIQDIFDTPGGKDWWLIYGESVAGAEFDLKDGSRSMKVLTKMIMERQRK